MAELDYLVATRSTLTSLEALKISLFARGLHIMPDAQWPLTDGGRVPLSVHEYTTTGGVTLVLADNVYVNAPFDNVFCDNPEATLNYDKSAQTYVLKFRGSEWPARALPLPGFLDTVDSQGRPVTNTAFSHADRVRLSPIMGCSFNCQFCDIPGLKYRLRPVDQLAEALTIAKADDRLPARHVLISGGTPSPRDYAEFDETYRTLVARAGLPVDLMMPPRPRDPGFIDRMADYGTYGFAINLEVYDDAVARTVTPQKQRIGLGGFRDAIERAVDRTGGQGRVRSLILVGLEPVELTLAGIEFLAELGCDPCLSPFRPSVGTGLADAPVPSSELLERVYVEAREITERHGVKLGPRCIPCQHNTLTFDDGSGAYHFS